MEIPLVYSTLKDEQFYVGSPVYQNATTSIINPVPLNSVDRLQPREDRSTVIIADIESLNRKKFSENFTAAVDLTGYDIWLIEAIRSSADILDSFMGHIRKLIIPCNTIKSWSVLNDAIELSEDCIPNIMAVRSKAVVCGGMFDVEKILEKITDMGFHDVLISDIDASLPKERWQQIVENYPNVIPYNHRPNQTAEIGCEDYAVDVFPPDLGKSGPSGSPAPDRS